MLLRLITFLVFSSPAIVATLWFSGNPGTVMVEWLDWRVETNVPVTLIAVLAFCLVFFALESVLAASVNLPHRIRDSRSGKRHRKGVEELLAALDAAANGDAEGKRRHAAEASRLLESPAAPPCRRGVAAARIARR
ncbi:MAG: heme biosynthesis HemY N-terminal domain-containing protein, partial [Alphaproteobacteria bacterium]|nr:heme biosynthesis HemY N-terminal domain-containing protein [Alphaproteobacteria bacterium]